MNNKKVLLGLVLFLIVVISCFSQTDEESFSNISIGLTGSYNLFNPSIWNIGIMAELIGFRTGLSVGEATVIYEKENPYSSTRQLTEYWQKSLYFDIIVGYVYQLNLLNLFSLRFGADIMLSMSNAFEDQHNIRSRTALSILSYVFTGVVGVKLFPKEIMYFTFDVCPGYALPIAAIEGVGAFVMPMRVGVGFNF